jgi:dolichyl-phosphate-mannose-protein mannosyltransferase
MAGRPGRARERWTAAILAATAALAVYAAALAATGGFTVNLAGLRLRSHSWERPALLALVGVALLVGLARAQVAALFARAWSTAESPLVPRALLAVALIWTLSAGLMFGTFANGGADSYGYVGQARLLAHGQLTDTIPLDPGFSWPDVEATLTPLGFTQGQARGVIAPKYPPGLPLLFAPLTRLSERAVYLLVPIFGVLTIAVTYRVGMRLGDPLAAGIAALILSLSPTFLFQVVQPLSDVPATACWLAALVAAASGAPAAAAGAGALASLAILIRPNLAPLAVLVLLAAHLSPPAGGRRWRPAVAFVAALLPGILVLGWIQNVRYGSPFASGYGTLEQGFSPGNILPNLERYPRWLTETHTWFIWLALLAPLWIARRASHRTLAWIAVAVAAAVWVAYLPYAYFQPREWFYARFLLPAIPVMVFFATAVALWGLRRLPVALRAPVTTALLVVLALTLLESSRARGVFDIRAQEQKYPRAGAFVRDSLPPAAFVLAMQHSGSIRYYANRPTLRWDLLDPHRLDDTIAMLRARGFVPCAVVDAAEDEAFRRRFEDARQRAVRRLTPLAVLGDTRIYGFE